MASKSPVGQSIPHDSAALHVSGAAQYIDDIQLPQGALYAAVGQTSIARGEVSKLDLSKVEAATGVVGTLTYADLKAQTDVGPVFPGDPLLVDSEVLFHGQALFLVAATSEKQARRAVLLAQVDYKPADPILDIDAAREAGARVRPVHELCKGSPESALQGAKHQLNGTLHIGGQEHLYLEGQAAIATPTEEGGVHIYTSSQHPSEVQTLVAEVLGIPFNLVCVEVRRMGGGFGGKESQAAPWACLAALMARKLGRAVKLRLPRVQDMMLTGKRHPFFAEYSAGFDDLGRIASVLAQLHGDCGCSPDLSDAIVDRAMFHFDNAYELPNARITGERWRTDKVSNTAFRGFGGPQGMLAGEAMVQHIARIVGRDPLDVRYANLYPEHGGTTPYHQSVSGEQLQRMMQRVEQTSNYRARRAEIEQHNKSAPRKLRGLALTPVKFGISFTARHLNQAGVLLHIYTDGSVLVSQAGTEMGQGLYTKVSQVVAAVLGIGMDSVRMSSTRTDKVPNTSPTAASSGADLNGMAARNAALALRDRLQKYISDREAVAQDRVNFADSKVIWPGGEQSFAAVVKSAYMERVSLSATGFYKTPEIWYDRDNARGDPFFYFAQGVACTEVEVDRLTGVTEVLSADILQDAGLSLNPAIDKGQIEGGYVQGLGWLTTEELRWNNEGALLTRSPATYKIPAVSNRPKQMSIELLQEPNSVATVYSSKAVGEPPLMLAISVWCAIEDALASYTQAPVTLDAPATPEAVIKALGLIN